MQARTSRRPEDERQEPDDTTYAEEQDGADEEQAISAEVEPLEADVAPLEGDVAPLEGDVAPTGRDAMQMSPTGAGGVALAQGSDEEEHVPEPERAPESVERAPEPERVEAAPEPPSPPAAEVHAPEPEERPQGPIIAVLNHDDVLIETVCEAFEAEGWHAVGGKVPVEEGGYVDILKFLVDHDPDVVVFDIVQPFADYLETLKAVRRAPEAKHRKFIVTTTDRAALQARGVPSAVQFREPEDLERVTDAVRVAVEQLGHSAHHS